MTRGVATGGVYSEIIIIESGLKVKKYRPQFLPNQLVTEPNFFA
jgi:hypothetical protein